MHWRLTIKTDRGCHTWDFSDVIVRLKSYSSLHLLLQSLTLRYSAKKHKNNFVNVYATKAEILQNDLLRYAKLGPKQNQSRSWRWLFLLFLLRMLTIFVVPLCSFFIGEKMCSLFWLHWSFARKNKCVDKIRTAVQKNWITKAELNITRAGL